MRTAEAPFIRVGDRVRVVSDGFGVSAWNHRGFYHDYQLPVGIEGEVIAVDGPTDPEDRHIVIVLDSWWPTLQEWVEGALLYCCDTEGLVRLVSDSTERKD